MSQVVVIADSDFEAEVLKSDQIVLVYFWASWCGPCRLMAPVMEAIASSYRDRLKVIKMEVDPNPESVAHCQVEGVPAFRIFRDGQQIDAFEGAINKQKLESFLSPHLPQSV